MRTLKVVDQDTDGFKPEKVRQVFLHLAEEAVVVPLRAYLTCEPQCINDGLLSGLDLSQGQSSFVPQLQIIAEDLEDLLICNLEAHEFVILFVEAGLTLEHHHDFIVLMNHWLD